MSLFLNAFKRKDGNNNSHTLADLKPCVLDCVSPLRRLPHRETLMDILLPDPGAPILEPCLGMRV